MARSKSKNTTDAQISRRALNRSTLLPSGDNLSKKNDNDMSKVKKTLEVISGSVSDITDYLTKTASETNNDILDVLNKIVGNLKNKENTTKTNVKDPYKEFIQDGIRGILSVFYGKKITPSTTLTSLDPKKTIFSPDTPSIFSSIFDNLDGKEIGLYSMIDDYIPKVIDKLSDIYNSIIKESNVQEKEEKQRETLVPVLSTPNFPSKEYNELIENVKKSLDIEKVTDTLKQILDKKTSTQDNTSLIKILTTISKNNDIYATSILGYLKKIADKKEKITNTTNSNTTNNNTTNNNTINSNPSSSTVQVAFAKDASDLLKDFIDVMNASTKTVNTANISSTVSGIASLFGSIVSIGLEKKKLQNINNNLRYIVGKDDDDNSILSYIAKISNAISQMSVPKDSKVADISGMLNSIQGLVSLDDDKYRQVVSNLRKLENLTSDENILSKVGLSDRGLIKRIMINLIELGKEVHGTSNGNPAYAVMSLSSFLKSIIETTQQNIEEDQIENLESGINTLIDLYSDKGPFKRLVDTIVDFNTQIGNTKDIAIDTNDKIKSLLDSLYVASDLIDFKRIVKLNAGVLLISLIGETAQIASKIFNKVDIKGLDDALTVILGIQYIADAINYFNGPKRDKLIGIENILGETIVLSLQSMLAGFVAKKALKSVKPITSFAAELESLISAFANMSSKPSDAVNNITPIKDIFVGLMKIEVSAIVAGALSTQSVKGLLKLKKEVVTINTLINVITQKIKVGNVKVASERLSKVADLISVLSMISIVSAVMLPIVTLGIAGLFMMNLAAKIIVKVVDSLAKIKVDDNSFDELEKASKLIVVASLVMLLGAAVGTFVATNLVSLLMFTGMLSLFILSVVSAYKVATKGIEKAFDGAKEFGELLLVSAGIMFLGGTFLTLFPQVIPGIILFTGLLAGFIAGISTVYKFAAKQLRENIKTIDTVKKVVVGSAAIMMIGAIWMMIPNMQQNAIAFGLTLAAFIGIMALAYKAITWLMGDKALHSMEQFNSLIVTCAATMAIGALFMYIPGFAVNAILFALEVFAFVTLISAPYLIMTKFGGKKMIKSAKELNRIIVVSAATMLIGGLFMMIPGMDVATIEFAVILGIFVGAVTLAFGFAAKRMTKGAMFAMIGITALVIASSIVMLAAGMLMMKYPDLGASIREFLFYDALMIVGAGLLAVLAGKRQEDIYKGILPILAIEGLVWASSKVMDAIIAGVDKIDGRWDDMDNYLKRAAIIFGSVLGLTAAVAAIVGIGGPEVGAAIAAAEALLAGIVGIVYLCAKAMDAVADSMIKFQDVEPLDFDTIISNLCGYLKMLGPLAALSGIPTYLLLKSAAINISLISETISDISQTVHQFASLTIPVYRNGKQVGIRKFEKSDIEDASENIKTILTTIGGAVIDLYKSDSNGIFGNFMNSFLHIDTPFSRVCKSCNNLGKMISSIAEGVKDMATLHVPMYVNGKKVGYRSLNDSDFQLANDNIGKIVTTLGGAVMAVYDMHPEMFQDKSLLGFFFGGSASNTPFAIVVKVCTSMGKMISSIANGIRQMAKLQIPIYKGTQIVGYDTLTSKDFDKVGTNIETIITCLARGVVNAYKSGQKGNVNLFDDPSKWYEPGNRAPIAMALKTFKGIGAVVSEMAKGIQDIVNLKIPYVKNGQIIEGKYVPLNLKDLDPNNENAKLTKTLTYILASMPTVMMKIYKAHLNDHWWDVTFWTHDNKSFGAMKSAYTYMTAIFNSATSAIDKIISMKMEEKNTSVLQQKLEYVMTALPTAMSKALYLRNEEGKEIENKLLNGDSDDLLENVQTYYKEIGEAISEAVKGYNSIIDLMNSKVGEKQVNLSVARHHLIAAVTTIPTTFRDLLYGKDSKHIIDIIGKDNIASTIKTSYANYADAISEIVSVYQNVIDLLPDKDAKQQYTIDGITSSIKNIANTTKNLAVALSSDVLKDINLSFVGKMENLSKGLEYLKQAYKDFPNLSTSMSLDIASAIREVNRVVSEVPNTHKFAKETENVYKFVSSVNKLDLSRTSSMIDLVTAIDKMASNIDGLDKFTKTVANQLVVVLKHLTDELKSSAKTISQAERIQKERHKHIQESIYKINSLLNNPVQVVVSQQDDNANKDDTNPDSPSPVNSSTSTQAKGSSSSRITFQDSASEQSSILMTSLAGALKKLGIRGQSPTGPNNKGIQQRGTPVKKK